MNSKLCTARLLSQTERFRSADHSRTADKGSQRSSTVLLLTEAQQALSLNRKTVRQDKLHLLHQSLPAASQCENASVSDMKVNRVCWSDKTSKLTFYRPNDSSRT